MSGKKANRIRLSGWDYAVHIVNYTVFFLFTLVCVYPFYYIIINSLSEGTMVDLGKVLWKPIGLTFYNYKKMLALADIYTAAKISVIRTIVGTAVSVVATAYAAYFFSKREMWGHRFWYRFTIVTMYFSAGLIPGYLNIRSLGLIDTFLPINNRSKRRCAFTFAITSITLLQLVSALSAISCLKPAIVRFMS